MTMMAVHDGHCSLVSEGVKSERVLVESERIELSSTGCRPVALPLSYDPDGPRDWIRTSDPPVPGRTLYQTELLSGLGGGT